MPELLNEAWEYWTPDIEIAEAMGDHAASGFDGLPVVNTPNGTPRADGFRFGRGLRGVNADLTRLARGVDPGVTFAQPTREPKPRKPRVLPGRACAGCAERFSPGRPEQRYCGLSCRGVGRRTLPTWVCATCGAGFRSCNPRPRFCSIVCRGKNSRGRVTLDFRQVLALKTSGLSVKAIARKMSASVSTVQRVLATSPTSC